MNACKLNDNEANYYLKSLSSLKKLESLNINLRQPGLLHDFSFQLNNHSIKELSLNLDGNQFSQKGGQSLGESLENLTNLESLKLNLLAAYMTDDIFKPIALSLSNLRRLTNLKIMLYGAKLTYQSMKVLNKSFHELTNLKNLDLDLNSNKIKSEGMGYLADAFQSMAGLTTLSLQLKQNDIGIRGAKYLKEIMQYLPNLKNLTLNIMWNDLEIGGNIVLSQGLATLKNVENLELHLQLPSQFHIEEIREFKESLGNGLEAMESLNNLTLQIYGIDLVEKEMETMRSIIFEHICRTPNLSKIKIESYTLQQETKDFILRMLRDNQIGEIITY